MLRPPVQRHEAKKNPRSLPHPGVPIDPVDARQHITVGNSPVVWDSDMAWRGA